MLPATGKNSGFRCGNLYTRSISGRITLSQALPCSIWSRSFSCKKDRNSSSALPRVEYNTSSRSSSSGMGSARRSIFLISV